MSDNIVKFLMPDGSEVSNDPKFDQQKALQEYLDSTPNKGDVGITIEEQIAQTQTSHEATLNSGQPGVGSNPTPDDPKDLLPVNGSGLQLQRDDAAHAEYSGASATNTSVTDPEPVDSNQAVLDARKALEARQAKAAKAEAALGEGGPGDPEVDKSEWSVKQLKAELTRRNAEYSEEDQLDTAGITTKDQLVELLKNDDERVAGQTQE